MPVRWRRSSTQPRWFEFAPEVALAVALGAFAATEPHAAWSAFRSTKAIALMIAVALAWLALRALTFATVKWRVVRALPFVVGAVVIFKSVVFPAYDDQTVVETLAATSSTSSPTNQTTIAGIPMTIRRGTFTGIDHRAAGDVNIYRRSDGAFLVGLEDFDIQPGPAYALYVVPGPDREDRDGGTRLAALRGNRGTQFYDVPPTVDLDGGEWTVLVWCETFDVPVAHSTPIRSRP